MYHCVNHWGLLAMEGAKTDDANDGAIGDGDALRRAVIEEAAYEVLAERGYRRTSMLAVAKRAYASNASMYRWYGSKDGLFAALIRRNADEAVRLLEEAAGGDIDARMVAFGTALLRVLTGDRAVALNRAAAADAAETGELGRELARSGRDRVLPMLRTALERARVAGVLTERNLDEIAERYVALLVGDLQIRRATGAMPVPPDEATLARRAETAWAIIRTGRTDRIRV